MTDPQNIFQADLDIFNSDITDGIIGVRVGQEANTKLDYSGGNLQFDCDAIEIYTPDNNEISFDKLVLVCREYWDDFEKK